MYCVYKVRNIFNNKVYIGKTDNIVIRWNSHTSDARNGCELTFHKNIREIGEDNFEIFILEEFESEIKALQREMFWIKYYKSNIRRYGDAFGFNMTDGGEGWSGTKHTEEFKKKVSILFRGENNKSAKLTDLKVIDIKMLFFDKNIRMKDIAATYNVNITIIEKIKSGEGWKHVILQPKHIEQAKQMALLTSPPPNPLLGRVRTTKIYKEPIRSKEQRERISIAKLGEKNPNSILNEQKVKEIKALFAKGILSSKDISIKYGVASRTIRDIRNGKSWSNVK
jgi:group I intron endonuclease